MALQIIYEDNHLIAVNKPAGMLVQGDETGDQPLSELVKEYIKLRYDKPGEVFLGVIHRIDRPVSGVVVFARTSKGLERMNALFRDRKVEKTYWAVVTERPNPIAGHLEDYIHKDPERNIVKALDRPTKKAPDAKLSELDYELIGEINHHCLLEVRPMTGRKHQIRAQLAKLGCPIRGDVKYGARYPNSDASIHLHCRSLAFEHPVKKEPVRIIADPPHEPVWDMFEGLWED
jgi:23S rRNA pseudouridine1911/1915/1917 synthase